MNALLDKPILFYHAFTICEKNKIKTIEIIEPDNNQDGSSSKKYQNSLKLFKIKRLNECYRIGEIVTSKINHFHKLHLGFEFKVVCSQSKDEVYFTVTYMIEDLREKNTRLSNFLVFDLHKEKINFKKIAKQILKKYYYTLEKKLYPIKFEYLKDVFFNSESSSKLFHEIISHPLESDFICNSFYEKKFFNNKLSVIENYKLEDEVDDDGNQIIHNIELIKDGYTRRCSISKETGNMYQDFFSDNKRILPRTKASYFKIMKSPVRLCSPYLKIIEISYGFFDFECKTVTLFINNAIFITKKNKHYKIKPFFISIDLLKLYNLDFFGAGNINHHSSLCIKQGNVSLVHIYISSTFARNFQDCIIDLEEAHD